MDSVDTRQTDGLRVLALGANAEDPGRCEPVSLGVLHGFTQNAGCWGPFGQALSEQNRVTAVDLPGHGESHHDNANLWDSGDLAVEAIGPAVYVGYSMGGRVALHAALRHPGAVQGLVLLGAHPGLLKPHDREARIISDAKLAARLRSEPLDEFLRDWLSNPLFAGLPEAAQCMEERMTNRPEGLAASLEACGTGSQEPLWDRLVELTMPVLVMAGEQDPKFTALAAQTVQSVGSNAQLVTIPNAGHSVHLEQPEATAAKINEFLARSFFR